jgi:ADP-ribosylglycohydrolase
MSTKSKTLIGAIAGDVIGSVYEWHNVKTTRFPLFSPECRFTDDTVLTVPWRIVFSTVKILRKPSGTTVADTATQVMEECLADG